MAKHCNLCTNEYNLDDYEPNMVIPSIMKDKGFCFDCAFWSWRLEHDIALILLHDDQERFLDAFYKDKNIDRKNPSYVDLDEYNLPDDKELQRIVIEEAEKLGIFSYNMDVIIDKI